MPPSSVKQMSNDSLTEPIDAPAPYTSKMVHIDDWLDEVCVTDLSDGERYARLWFEIARMPAFKKDRYARLQGKLFCNYKGTTYRVNGASRMGDIWLEPDFNNAYGYQLRVFVDECYNWRKEP
jgi:hypothetical protein